LSILRVTLSAVREREDVLRESLGHDREMLEAKLGELKKAALEGNADFAALKETGSRLSEVKRQLDVLVRPFIHGGGDYRRSGRRLRFVEVSDTRRAV